MNICAPLRPLWIAFLLASPLRAEVAVQAFGEIPPNAVDSLGDTIGGLGSAVCYDAKTRSVFMMPDRGAGDGAIDYRPRCYRIRFTRNAADPKRLDYKIEQTILFRDAEEKPFTGLLAGTRSKPLRDGSRCLDPEAISTAPDGTLYVSDEYGPALMQFDRSGHLLRAIPLPEWFRPRGRDGRPDYRPAPNLRSGRDDNRGAEAMGILPDGKRAILILQSALVQDGGRPAGTTRVVILDLRTGAPLAEYAYAFADPQPWNPAAAKPRLGFRDLSVNDLAVVNDHTLLVLERDGLGRDGPIKPTVARYKSVWIANLSGATNLLSLPGRPYDQLPGHPAFKPLSRHAPVSFVRKTLLFNLPDLTPPFGISAKSLAAKWEGLTLLPPKSPQHFRLLMTADNDFLNPKLVFNGVTHRFPRARDAVPTQIVEILARVPKPIITR
ncbi:MAG: esterase-like activity of phytase family protein [Terrimicrobiaceae bacterium]|nr:esterase-like activity of phytase family protein [Terrimicrobiaceae bacterium]